MSILDERPSEVPPEDHTKVKLILVSDKEEGRKDPARGIGIKIPLDDKFKQFFKNLGEKLKFW